KGNLLERNLIKNEIDGILRTICDAAHSRKSDFFSCFFVQKGILFRIERVMKVIISIDVNNANKIGPVSTTSISSFSKLNFRIKTFCRTISDCKKQLGKVQKYFPDIALSAKCSLDSRTESTEWTGFISERLFLGRCMPAFGCGKSACRSVRKPFRPRSER
ncbi:MAG: hypothetical protein WCQ55_07350, partial [Paludibacteraceae bacterium]